LHSRNQSTALLIQAFAGVLSWNTDVKRTLFLRAGLRKLAQVHPGVKYRESMLRFRAPYFP
jgi:hypothetical protein